DAAHLRSRHRLSADHSLHRVGRENPNTVVFAFVENHLTKDREIIGNREKPGVPRHAAHFVRARIVHFTTHPSAFAVFGRSGSFDFSTPFNELVAEVQTRRLFAAQDSR